MLQRRECACWRSLHWIWFGRATIIASVNCQLSNRHGLTFRCDLCISQWISACIAVRFAAIRSFNGIIGRSNWFECLPKLNYSLPWSFNPFWLFSFVRLLRVHFYSPRIVFGGITMNSRCNMHTRYIRRWNKRRKCQFYAFSQKTVARFH